MTRPLHATSRQTAARIERIRILINALLAGDMTRDEIGEVLQVGPSGVRKYLADLDEKVEIAGYIDGTATFVGFPVFRLAITPEAAQAYLDGLATVAPVRVAAAPISALSVAARDPSRHFHILADDAHYTVRVSRAQPMRDPLVAALFGTCRHEVRA